MFDTSWLEGKQQPTFQSSAVSLTVVSRVCSEDLALIQEFPLNSPWNTLRDEKIAGVVHVVQEQLNP